jgi:hypothetical protein
MKAGGKQSSGFLRGLFNYEDVDGMFVRNIGWLSTDYAEFYPRR